MQEVRQENRDLNSADMLSKKETQYVVKTITKKLDSMTVDDGGGGFDDEG